MLINYLEVIVITFINSGGIFLIIELLANFPKEKTHLWFAILTISIIGWVDFAYLGYYYTDLKLALIFARINFAFVSIFFFAEYMLYIEGFLNIIKPKVRWIILIISSILFLLSLLSDTIVNSNSPSDWGNEFIYGPINDFFSLFAFLLNIVIMFALARMYFKFQSEEKTRTLFFLIGTFLCIILNIIFNIFSPIIFKSSEYQRLGDYSAVFLLSFTAYAILRHKFLDIKIAATAFLIGIISMLLIVDILALSNNLAEQAIKSVILIFFAAISTLLVRGIITGIKQREALELSEQKYFKLSNEQKDIIDIMGHEIKTPLSIIFQEIELNKAVLKPKMDEWKKGNIENEDIELLVSSLNSIDTAIMQANNTVNVMLDTARLDKDKFKPNYSKFNLNKLVSESVHLISKTAVNIYAFKVDLPDDELIVNADKASITQALNVLLDNAIKYSKEKTVKSIIFIKVKKEKNFVTISVKDNGIGIEKRDISKLGYKFVRLDPKTKSNLPRPGGTGLGLYVVKGIMKFHNGELIIESDGLGNGSTFTLKFPINKTVSN